MPRGREINRLIVVPFYELKLLMLCGTSYLKYFVIFPLAVQKGGRPVGDSKVPDACNFLLCCRHVINELADSFQMRLVKYLISSV